MAHSVGFCGRGVGYVPPIAKVTIQSIQSQSLSCRQIILMSSLIRFSSHRMLSQSPGPALQCRYIYRPIIMSRNRLYRLAVYSGFIRLTAIVSQCMNMKNLASPSSVISADSAFFYSLYALYKNIMQVEVSYRPTEYNVSWHKLIAICVACGPCHWRNQTSKIKYFAFRVAGYLPIPVLLKAIL